VNDDIIGRTTVVIAALDGATPRLPNLDSAIFRARDHPFTLAVKGNASDVAGVTLESQKRVWVRGFDVVELDGMMAGRSEEALVGRDAETVDLGVWVLDCPRADSREGLPEPWEQRVLAFTSKRKPIIIEEDCTLLYGHNRLSSKLARDALHAREAGTVTSTQNDRHNCLASLRSLSAHGRYERIWIKIQREQKVRNYSFTCRRTKRG
jgi:hypothetical protein